MWGLGLGGMTMTVGVIGIGVRTEEGQKGRAGGVVLGGEGCKLRCVGVAGRVAEAEGWGREIKKKAGCGEG